MSEEVADGDSSTDYLGFIGAVVTFGLALLPAVYTVFPQLSEDPGFWRDRRFVVFVVWAVFLFFLLIGLAVARNRQSQRIVRDVFRKLQQLESEQSLPFKKSTIDRIVGLSRRSAVKRKLLPSDVRFLVGYANEARDSISIVYPNTGDSGCR